MIKSTMVRRLRFLEAPKRDSKSRILSSPAKHKEIQAHKRTTRKQIAGIILLWIYILMLLWLSLGLGRL
ncbi:MAG TPA: hypothetical protein VHM64_09900 [Candidatus Binatia bacterium]|nr:hypothetical protein [Candidatus Binatia bacterium]